MPSAKAQLRDNSVKTQQRSTKKRHRKSVAQILPEKVIEGLSAQLDEPLTAARVKQISTALDTENKFGVSPRRLGYLLRKLKADADRLRQSSKPTTNQESKQAIESSEENENDNWPKRMQSHRRRQITIASILDSTFGKIAKNSPDLWVKRTYLMLVGAVYDRLVSNEKGLDTDELVKLAKVLAEGRRGEPRAKETGGSLVPMRRAITNGAMPKHLVDTVRQIYGVSLDESAHTQDRAGEESSSTASASSET